MKKPIFTVHVVEDLSISNYTFDTYDSASHFALAVHEMHPASLVYLFNRIMNKTVLLDF